MKPTATLRALSIALGALLLTPLSVRAHSEGAPHHAEAGQSQSANKPSDSGMYRWKDDRGMVHYSQGLQSVPEQFRATAVPLGQATSPAAEPRKP
ncbi:MAG: DUF4124 domain-containing protein [Candidatus Rokubacteria bacterium]|nr:DUF4124 domain-containing protein [Candidatus Rokubacteria bacterium]MBI2544066.1 DUF4124 domain-containing protein [Candidatus Rokubacteria bacterium]